MNKYAFVIGAHKTGTTYLNKLLSLNIEQLNNKKIWFEASKTVRPKVSAFLSPRADEGSQKRVKSYLFDGKGAYDRVVFSNENISGHIPSFFNRKELYPNIGSRLSELNTITGRKEIDIVIFIRSYDEFIVSCYSEFIRARGFDITFKEFQDAVLATEPSWVNIVGSVQSAYPNSTIKVLQQQDIANDIGLVTQTVFGCQFQDLKAPAEFEGRQAMSASGIDVLALMAHFGYDDVEAEFVNRLATILPASKHFGRPYSMNDSDIEHYKSLYREHLKELSELGYLIRA